MFLTTQPPQYTPQLQLYEHDLIIRTYWPLLTTQSQNSQYESGLQAHAAAVVLGTTTATNRSATESKRRIAFSFLERRPGDADGNLARPRTADLIRRAQNLVPN
jgi:hypothetical protein